MNKTVDLNEILSKLFALNTEINKISKEIWEGKFILKKGKKYKLLENKLLNLRDKLSEVDKYFESNLAINGSINELEYKSYQLQIVSSYRNICESNLLNSQKLLDNINQDVQNRLTTVIAIISLLISSIAIVLQ